MNQPDKPKLRPPHRGDPNPDPGDPNPDPGDPNPDPGDPNPDPGDPNPEFQGRRTFVGTSSSGNIAEALEAAIATAKESLETSLLKWELLSVQGESGGFIEVNNIQVTIGQQSIFAPPIPSEPWVPVRGRSQVGTDASQSDRTIPSDPGVKIESTGVHNQCRPGVNSIMLNNQSVKYYRITVLRRGARDDHLVIALKPHTWQWIGCEDDGFRYSIESLLEL